MKKKKSAEYIKGFKAGWLYLTQNLDMKLRELEDELEEVVYEMNN